MKKPLDFSFGFLFLIVKSQATCWNTLTLFITSL